MTKQVQNEFTAAGTVTGSVGALAENLVSSAVGALSPLNNFARYMTGARAIIKVNGKLFGFAYGVNYTINTPHEEVWTIDDWTAYELAPQRISISGTLGMFHVPGKSPTEQLVQANVLSYLMHKYITIEISDQMTGEKIFKTERAVITSKSQNLNAGELSTINLTWKAIGWIDELTPKYPEGADGSSPGAGNFNAFDLLKGL
jgi:hypothetical protein